MTVEMKDIEKLFDGLKSNNEEKMQKEIKGLGVSELKETQEAINAKMNASEEKFEAEKAKVEALEVKTAAYDTAIEEIKVAMERDGEGVDKGEEADMYAKAVDLFIRKGEENEDLTKALSTDSDPDGGFRLAAGTTANIVTFQYETSPMRQHASVTNISGTDMMFNIDNDEAGAGWVGEKSLRTETSTPQFQTKRIVPYEIFAEPRATQKQLDDADFDVESWLAGKVSDRFSRMENSAFVNGDGVEKPRGFLTYDAGKVGALEQDKIEQIISGHATLLTGDGVLSLEASLKDQYVQGSKYFTNRTSLGSLRLLKDGQGNYLWAPGFNGKTSATLNGYEYARLDDMPAVGAGSLSLAFGNMKSCYQIVDRIGIRTLRDPFTAKPFVKFYTTKRVGGDVVNFEALKLQVTSV
tara:strand:+ start:6322 stop:7551 length:1230 start_codon:yes stop_codon:yes gene_type:complete